MKDIYHRKHYLCTSTYIQFGTRATCVYVCKYVCVHVRKVCPNSYIGLHYGHKSWEEKQKPPSSMRKYKPPTQLMPQGSNYTVSEPHHIFTPPKS